MFLTVKNNENKKYKLFLMKIRLNKNEDRKSKNLQSSSSFLFVFRRLFYDRTSIGEEHRDVFVNLFRIHLMQHRMLRLRIIRREYMPVPVSVEI